MAYGTPDRLLHWLIVTALSGLGLLAAATTSFGQGQVGISSPAPDSRVSGVVPILGTAAGAPFARYELYYKREPSGDEAYIYFHGDTRQVHSGQLGVWYTGDLAPGIYTLRMRVVRPDSNYGEFFAPNISVNQVPPTAETRPDTPTETPIPIDTPTPLPQPTVAAVEVEQPNLEESATATPTPQQVAPDSTEDTGAGQAAGGAAGQTTSEQTPGIFAEELSVDKLRAHFFNGMRWSAGLFLLLGALFAAKRLLVWMLAKAE